MRAGLENNRIRRGLAALLVTGVVLVAGATSAAAGGYGSDGSDCATCPPPTTAPTTTTTPIAPPGPGTPSTPGRAVTYPVPTVPPSPGTPYSPPSSPPALARTGSNTGTLVGIGAGTLLVGGGLVLVARKRRLAVVPS